MYVVSSEILYVYIMHLGTRGGMGDEWGHYVTLPPAEEGMCPPHQRQLEEIVLSMPQPLRTENAEYLIDTPYTC
jgi:hypothetical protein